jgi:hypothetical protein
MVLTFWEKTYLMTCTQLKLIFATLAYVSRATPRPTPADGEGRDQPIKA